MERIGPQMTRQDWHTECAKHYLGLKDGGSGLLILFQQESGFSWLIQFCQYLAAAAAAGSVNLQRERCQQSFLNLITSFINWFLGTKTETISVNLHSEIISFFKIFKNGPTPVSFSLFLSLLNCNWQFQNKLLVLLGFEPQISGVGSDRSANWATTTAHFLVILC